MNEVLAREARWYEKLEGNKVRCHLCAHRCLINEGKLGICQVRKNEAGTLMTLVYGRTISQNVDPIEKKPLFHVMPGSLSYSIATPGCNFRCLFCQNADISQMPRERHLIMGREATPAQIVDAARRSRCRSIAYTYTEPVVFAEYMYDISKKAKGAGIYNVMISNGYIQEEPMRALAGVLTAVKVDLKAITEKFYREVVAGELKPVLDTLVLLRKWEMWTEIVYLVIPTLNDKEKEFKELARWIKTNLGEDVPIHFTRFHPQYKLQNLPPTPQRTLERARDIALAEGIKFVYIGNVPGHPAENTYCPRCGQILIERRGFMILKNRLINGQCPACNTDIPGIWS
ncbi:MAG: AmmeMemoRadiSam system radical SAM enzyme [Calditrichia bacterium]